jgi:hypothetical protein
MYFQTIKRQYRERTKTRPRKIPVEDHVGVRVEDLERAGEEEHLGGHPAELDGQSNLAGSYLTVRQHKIKAHRTELERKLSLVATRKRPRLQLWSSTH